MQSFVDTSGGFLFIQKTMTVQGVALDVQSKGLSNWGIGNSAGNIWSRFCSLYLRGTSDQGYANPNVVTGFIGSAHSTINEIPEVLKLLHTMI